MIRCYNPFLCLIFIHFPRHHQATVASLQTETLCIGSAGNILGCEKDTIPDNSLIPAQFSTLGHCPTTPSSLVGRIRNVNALDDLDWVVPTRETSVP